MFSGGKGTEFYVCADDSTFDFTKYKQMESSANIYFSTNIFLICE